MRKIAICTAMLATAGLATTAFGASPKATDGARALKVNNTVSVDARAAAANRGIDVTSLQGTGPIPGGVVGSCQCFWDNGSFDPATGNGQGSAMEAALDGLCADDFFLPECSIYRIDDICAEMLVTDPMAGGLSFGVAIFADCNGKPYGAPLYVFDEWNAYVNGAAVAVGLEADGLWTRGWRDAVMGPLEFTVYAIATVKAVADGDPAYFAADTQLRAFTAWNIRRAMALFEQGRAMADFAWQTQDDYAAALRTGTGAGVEALRQFARDTWGPTWCAEVLGF